MATATATRPNSLITMGAATNNSGTVPTNVDDDPADDLTGYRLPNSIYNLTKIGFATPTKPAGAIWKEGRIRVRLVGGRMIYWQLLSGGVAFAGGVYDQSLPVGTRDFGGGSVSSLSSIEFHHSTTGYAGFSDVTELYFDGIYVAKPTLVISAPTSPQNQDNTPTVSWTNTLDSDGGAQTKYQVKVFDSATYGGGGFDPSTSTSDYDSGVLTSSATSHVVTTALANDTYRAYIRVAQTVNGSDFWSDWTTNTGSPGQWTQSVTPAEVPGLTATADSPNGRITLQLTETNAARATGTSWYELERSVDGGTTWEPVRTFEDEGKLLPPHIIASTTATDSADGTSHAITVPTPWDGSSIQEGDLLMIIAGMDGNPSYSWPTGWVELSDAAGNGSAVRHGTAYYRALGGEQGSSITVTTSASEGGGLILLVIRGSHPTTAPEIGTNPTGATANPDPPSSDPTNWGTEDTLWLPTCVWDNGAGTVTCTTAPSNFDDLTTAVWANAAGAGVAVALRLEKAASVDPGTFTLSASEDWGARTIAVRPADEANLTLYDYEAPNGVTVQYRARTAHIFSSGTVVYSDWSSPVDTAAWTDSDSYWLKVPEEPDLNGSFTLKSFVGFQQEGRVGVFQALGAPPSDAVAVTDHPGPDTGTFTIRADSDADRDALDAIFDSGRVILFQDVNGNVGDRYMALTGRNRERHVDVAWSNTSFDSFNWTEVSAPDGELVSAE